MNWLDIMIIVSVLLATFVGWRMGIIRAITTLVGTGAGIWVAGIYYDEVADQLSSFISNENVANVAGFAIVFVVIFIAVGLVGSVVKRILKFLFLGWLDSTVGGALGLALGATFAAVAVVVFNTFGLDQTVDESYLASLFLDKYPVVMDMLPGEFQAVKDYLP